MTLKIFYFSSMFDAEMLKDRLHAEISPGIYLPEKKAKYKNSRLAMLLGDSRVDVFFYSTMWELAHYDCRSQFLIAVLCYIDDKTEMLWRLKGTIINDIPASDVKNYIDEEC